MSNILRFKNVTIEATYRKVDQFKLKKTSMATKWQYGILISGIVIMTSCDKDSPDNNSQLQNLKEKNIIVNSNTTQLSSRIKKLDQLMQVEDVDDSRFKSTMEPPKVDLTKNYTFTLRAEVAPPEFEGKTLMATHVKILDKYAFVTYNTKGDAYLGGLEVFDVTDISNPKIVWQAIFSKADISAVDYYNNKLYIVGAQDISSMPDANLRKPALLEVLSLNEKREISKVDTIINLDSYAGTDIKVTADGIFTTSGSNGFLKVYNHNYDSVFSASISDARSVDVNSTNAYVLSGQPGKISVFNKSNHTFLASYTPDGANIPESKSEIAVNDKYIFSALNDGGLKVFKADGTLKQHINRPVTPIGMKDEDFVTNSVSLNGDMVLLGNGEAGLYIGGIVSSRNDSIFLLGSIKFNELESANFVESKDSIIFVATGLGGLKILSISMDEGVPDDIIPTKPCGTLYNKIYTTFPESVNNLLKYPELFEPQLSKSIILSKESEVYITFVNEGAGWKNSLGYYTYNLSNPPTSVNDLEKHILFPNVSEVNEGGGLKSGDMVQVGTGKFPPNTVVGFYLVAQGWKNGNLVAGRYTHYTDIQFNSGGHQQHTLFIEKTCNDLVMTFEDIDIEDNLSYTDFDYNDILFVISDNKDPNHLIATTSFDLRNIPQK